MSQPWTGWATLGVLLLGALTLWVVYRYFDAWRREYQDTMGKRLETGASLPAVHVLSAGVDVSRDPAAAGAAGGKLQIGGPDHLTVGAPAAFEAFLDEQRVSVAWVAEGPASCTPAEGESVLVTAREPGRITVKATHESGDEENVEVDAKLPGAAAAAAVDLGTGTYALVGEGYGGITIAVLSVTIGGALTLAGVLPGAALATLLGTVVSYFFAQRSK